jgi:hypothetical protein
MNESRFSDNVCLFGHVAEVSIPPKQTTATDGKYVNTPGQHCRREEVTSVLVTLLDYLLGSGCSTGIFVKESRSRSSRGIRGLKRRDFGCQQGLNCY